LVKVANNKIDGENMNKIVNRIKEEFKHTPDLKIKEVKINLLKKAYVIFIETICNSDKINDYILKNLVNYNNNNDLNSNIPGPNTCKINNEDEIEFYLTNGFAIIIIDNNIIAIEVKGDINRSINTSTREPSIVGAEDAFIENIQTNLGLIKRRIKSKTLKTEELFLGRKTQTKISINYLSDIAEEKIIKEIKKKLQKIDVDGVIDIGTIINYLEEENKSVFPTIRRTERPDLASSSLLEGKIVLLVDTSPFAIILPSFLIDFINPTNDNYIKSINVAFLKILRAMAFFISMTAPAIFLATINYNQETIPSSLLINFSTQRAGVPFPSIVELLILLIICDILRESDLRFPSNFGSAVSILGALIVGEAAVNAGIVSSIMIIIISFTFISSLIFTSVEIGNALRYYRYIFLFFGAFFGLYGIFLCLMLFLINVISLKSINAPYFAPIAPFNKDYFFKTALKKQDKNNTKRSTLITEKNLTRGRFN